ncbi:MAG TPA: GNAT family N-acetyltransferase [Candidatus Limnocylindrales bacterium]|nr:GNAT family N-acetyltransferase [Candidatus Limnocylindrales bacterium]
MSSAVRRATVEDVPAMAGTLARAFAHDPFYSFLAGDAPERGQRMQDGWYGILRFGSAGLAETYTTDEHAGVALWIPPGHRGPSFIDSLRMTPSIARLAGWGRMREVTNAIAALEERHRHHAMRPHFYLSALGVEPDRQGEGIGTKLMEPVLERCRREEVPAYLETATARNVLLYERLGFDVVEELTLPNTDVHGWLMLRPAERQSRPSTASSSARA